MSASITYIELINMWHWRCEYCHEFVKPPFRVTEGYTNEGEVIATKRIGEHFGHYHSGIPIVLGMAHIDKY